MFSFDLEPTPAAVTDLPKFAINLDRAKRAQILVLV